MTENRSRRVQPATVLALIALAVSLSGTAYAVSKITGKQIVNESVTGRDIQNSGLSGKELRASAIGPRQVREGQLGEVPLASNATMIGGRPAADLVGPVVVYKATAVVGEPAGTVSSALARCQAGEVLVGGGASPEIAAADNLVRFLASHPAVGGEAALPADGQAADGWSALAEYTFSASGQQRFTAYAICARTG